MWLRICLFHISRAPTTHLYRHMLCAVDFHAVEVAVLRVEGHEIVRSGPQRFYLHNESFLHIAIESLREGFLQEEQL